jgi:hypothetical protein
MTQTRSPEFVQAVGSFALACGDVDRTICEAVTEALAIVRCINPSESYPETFGKRVQKLLTFHRTRDPMRNYCQAVEPLLVEVGTFRQLRNDVAHGRAPSDIELLIGASDRLIEIDAQLAAAMVWRASPGS